MYPPLENSPFLRLSLRSCVAVIERCIIRALPLVNTLADVDADLFEAGLEVLRHFSKGKCVDELHIIGTYERLNKLACYFDNKLGLLINSLALTIGSIVIVNNCQTEKSEINKNKLFHVSYDIFYEISGSIVIISNIDILELLDMNFGESGTLGAPIDPSEFGPLGLLWPTGQPDWQSIFGAEGNT